MKRDVAKRPGRHRRTLHVEQEAVSDGGKVRRTERLTATKTEPDGSITSVERETIEDTTDDAPWFSTGTRRTTTKRIKPV